MLTETTITKLQEMRLSAMAAAFKEQLIDPNIAELSFEDRFGLLADREWLTHKEPSAHQVLPEPEVFHFCFQVMKKEVPFTTTPPHHLQTSQGAQTASQRCPILPVSKASLL